MNEYLSVDLSAGGIAILVITALVAGCARGFSGFGGALIFVPVASSVVGPKLAVRLVTELKGKAPVGGTVDAGTLGLQAALGEGIAGGNVSDAVSALVNLGYSSAQASAAVARVVGKEGDGLATDKLIRLGLKELSQ